MSVHIYVEGGGDCRATQGPCREGFSKFFKKIVPEGQSPKVIACGGRAQAFDRFKTALAAHRNGFVCLLVDSEASVAPSEEPWTHLKKQAGWDQPADATNDHAHLMVQCMEAWFIADKNALATYYGQEFQSRALSGRTNVEEIDKSDIEKGLEAATRNSRKGTYHKTRHAFDLLARIDPVKVCQASKHAKRFAETLKSKLA